MSAELKSTVAALQMKVASLEAVLAQLVEKEAKRETKRAAKKALPSSPPESETDTSETKPKKKAKKEKDPDAPKKAPNSWILFTMRVDALLKEHAVSGKAVENKQFASALKAKKAYDEWTDEQILAEKASWVKPEVSKQSMAKSDSDAESESKPKKVRGRPKKVKAEADAE